MKYHPTIRTAAMALAGALLLAGCGGDSDGGGGGSAQSNFGAGFDAAFNNGVVDFTANPVPVTAGDLVPVSFTTDPIDIPNP